MSSRNRKRRAEDARARLLLWTIGMADIRVSLCGSLLGPVQRCLPTSFAGGFGAFVMVVASFACGGAGTTGSADGADGDSGDSGSSCATISAGDYNQQCSMDSDCVAVASGSICAGKCACDFGAINVTDRSKYEAAFPNVETEACPCQPLAPTCQNGQCVAGSSSVRDAGPDGASAESGSPAKDAGRDGASAESGSPGCGGMTCASGQVCVVDQVHGGALIAPDDAGMCPGDRVLAGSVCESPPSYQCAASPVSCASGLSCTCAQSLCSSPYQCAQASAATVHCDLDAP